MQFQFSSDNNINANQNMAEQIEALTRARLSRIEDRLTRVEVHIGDVNGTKDRGDDKRCAMEIRPSGMDAITATDQASSIDAAVTGAANKVLAAFDRQIGKRTSRKGH
jgi:hypothetical protein